jgi:single-stranded DNA-binding protein
MIETLITGKLLRDTELKQGKSPYCNFMLSVNVGEPQPIVVSGIAFNEVAEQISQLKKGDSVAVAGSLKPTANRDKNTGEAKHGLNITVSKCLTVNDAKRAYTAAILNQNHLEHTPFRDSPPPPRF